MMAPSLRGVSALWLASLLAACAPQPIQPLPETPTPTPYCALSVRGADIVDERGGRVVMHGVDLPTLRAMRDAGQDPDAQLQAAQRAGAAFVRLAVTDAEVTPSFVPLTLLPVVQRANALGLLVILSWRNEPAQRINSQVDKAEDFLRLAVPAFRGYRGVWFEPLVNLDKIEAPPGRKRAIAARMVDVVRGLRDERVVVLTRAGWLTADDPTLSAPLAATNVVYAVDALEGAEVRVPVLLLGADVAQTPDVDGSVYTLAPGAVLPASQRCS